MANKIIRGGIAGVLVNYGVLILLSFVLTAIPGQAAEKTLRVALEHWPPYIDKEHPEYGMATELVTTALKRTGYDTTISFEDWVSALEGTRIGVYDVIVAGWYSEKREELFEFSKPYFYNEIKFLKVRGKPFQYNSLSDLQGLYIGTVENYAYSPEFDNNMQLIIIPGRTLVNNLSLLQQGEIDLTLDDKLVIRHQIMKFMPSSAKQFQFLEKPLDVRGLHLMVSRKHPDHKQIIAAFDQAIVDMKNDGSFDAIVKKYTDELKPVESLR